MLSYNKLFLLMGKKNIKKTDLRKQGLHPAVISKLVKNEIVRSDTIDLLCSLLHCQPGDIMEYVPDDEA